MKRVYWRPQKVSRKGLVAIGVAALVGLTLVLRSPVQKADHRLDIKWEAAQHAAAMLEEVKQERMRRGLPIEAAFDPARTGLIGNAMSMVTSRPSDLRSKQTSVNPNFAAAIIDMLTEAGVQAGDVVAVGWSGSFPAFNISVCAALDSLQVRPVVIASATSSQYGANLPELMWLDMETHLRQCGLTHCRSAAVSIGGAADRGLGLSPEARVHVETVARRNETPMLKSSKRDLAVSQRMALYRELADRDPIRAYINVGGGVASTGGEQGKHFFVAGLNRDVSRAAKEVNSVMSRFAKDGVPVIHLNQAKTLAATLSFPVAPVEIPVVGGGRPFHDEQPNRWLALAVLAGIFAGMQLCVWNGKSYQGIHRIVRHFRPRSQETVPQINEPTAEPQLMI